jgi:hypothetical protein
VLFACWFCRGVLADQAKGMVESLIKTEDLIRLKEAHTALPLTLSELKDFFWTRRSKFQAEDLISQSPADGFADILFEALNCNP